MRLIKYLMYIAAIFSILQFSSCLKVMKKPFENLLFGNSAFICVAPGVSFLAMNLAGKCQINKVIPENSSTLIGEKSSNIESFDVGAPNVVPTIPTGPITIDTVEVCGAARGSKKILINARYESNGNIIDEQDVSFPSGELSFNFDSTNAFTRAYGLTIYYDNDESGTYNVGDTLYQDEASGNSRLLIEYTPETEAQDEKIAVLQTNPIPITSSTICPVVARGDPLVIDIFSNGFKFEKSLKAFDYTPGGEFERWYGMAGNDNDDAFLVLDINGNNQIDDGNELFGNYMKYYIMSTNDSSVACKTGRTAECKFQKVAFPVLPKHGFQALAIYDTTKAGGNGNGLIDEGDMIYPYLKLWVQDPSGHKVLDKNLVPISAFLMEIDLGFWAEEEEDIGTGNLTCYRGKVRMTKSPIRLKSTVTGIEFDVFETAIADIFFNVSYESGAFVPKPKCYQEQ